MCISETDEGAQLESIDLPDRVIGLDTLKELACDDRWLVLEPGQMTHAQYVCMLCANRRFLESREKTGAQLGINPCVCKSPYYPALIQDEVILTATSFDLKSNPMGMCMEITPSPSSHV